MIFKSNAKFQSNKIYSWFSWSSTYRDSLGKSGAYAQQGKNCFKWCCILPGAKITHKGDDHIRTQTQEASVKTTSQISIYWAIG